MNWDNNFIVKNINALIGLKELENDSIDCIITDPPYPTISGGHGGKDSSSSAARPTGILSKNDGKIFDFNDIDIANWIGECYRVLKPDTHIYIMTNFLNLQHYMEEIQKVGFELHNLLIWEKNNATPNRWYMKNCEYIIFARKGLAKPINNCGTKTVLQIKNVKDRIHPTEKPVELLRILIENSSNENDIILDPFGGSFSTVLASLQCKRKCISFEIDEEYFNVGQDRLINFNPEEIILAPKKEKPLTQNQNTILEILKNNPDKDYNGTELAEITGLSSRTCSGCFSPLYAAGLIEKTTIKSPIRVKIKEKSH